MTSKHSTKKALWMSMLSILLCLSMLVGSTFAWFTDTASTGVNTIVAGNLDIALYKGDVTETEGVKSIAYTNEVSTSTKLFQEGTFWEPGYTEVAYLKIDNLGSLALKYQLTVNVINEVVGKSVTEKDIKLSEVLKYDVVELANATTFYADRAAALEAVETGANLKTEVIPGTMLPTDDAKYLAIIVYMPTSVDNDANHKTGTTPPSIQLGVNLVATQMEAELDSFDNQYDKGATYPTVATPTDVTATIKTPVNQGESVATDVVVNEANVTTTVPKENYPTSTTTTYTTEVSVELVKSDANSTTFEIDVTITDDNKTGEDANVALTKPVLVTVKNLTKGLSNVIVTHNGAGMNKKTSFDGVTADQDYFYDGVNGILYIMSQTFSPFEISYDMTAEASVNDVAYATLPEAIAAAKTGDTVKLLQDIKVPDTTGISKDSAWLTLITEGMTFDGCGHTIDASETTLTTYPEGGKAQVINIGEFNLPAKNVTVKNLTVIGGGIGVKHAINVYQSTDIKFENVTVKNAAAGIMINASTVTAANIKSEGNTWYGIGVDKAGAKLTIDHIGGMNDTIAIRDDVNGVTVQGGAYAVTEYGSSKFYARPVASIGNVNYGSLEAALAAAKSGETVTVLADTALTAAATVPAGVTLTGDVTVTVPNIKQVFTLGEGACVTGLDFVIPTGNITVAYITSNAKVENCTFTGSYQFGADETSRAVVVAPGAKNFAMTGNTVKNLRQPAYINNAATGTVSDNDVDITRGFVVCSDSNVSFTNNTFGENAVDICIIASNTADDHYANKEAEISAANGNAYVQNQVSGNEVNKP